jgi:hypothetical protein
LTTSPRFIEGNRLVNLLIAALRTKYARNSDKLHAWESASPLERTPQRADKTPAPAPATPAA